MDIIRDDKNGLKIYLKENDDKYVAFWYGGTLDLYWSLHSRNILEDNSIEVDKSNPTMYQAFIELFKDVETMNIYGNTKRNKSKYVFYNNLYDKENKTITWYSDETASEVSNYLKIINEEDKFKLEFFIQDHIEGYSHDFYNKFYIPIRFSNSGSKYDPFNIIFMRMFRNLGQLDDDKFYKPQASVSEENAVQKKLK